MSGLEELRARLRDVDARILAQVAERFRLVREIGARKKADGEPVRNFAVESEILQRVERFCREQRLPEALGREIFTSLIHYSVLTQDSLCSRLAPGNGQAVTVVGGSGHMGKWLADFFSDAGYRVTVGDPRAPAPGYRHQPETSLAVAGADLIVVAVPLREADRVLREILALKPTGVVADICSLKSPVLAALKAGVGEGLRVTSCHPMFGPGVDFLAGRNIILCECGCPEATRWLRTLFRETSALLPELPVEQHDELISYLLGASHLLNLLFTTVLKDSGFSFFRLERFGSTTFNHQVQVSREVSGENPELYYDIQVLNHHREQLLERFTSALGKLQTVILENRSDRFREIMREGCDYFKKQT